MIDNILKYSNLIGAISITVLIILNPLSGYYGRILDIIAGFVLGIGIAAFLVTNLSK